LLKAGDQVPCTKLSDDTGKVKVAPEHTADGNEPNVGVRFGKITIFKFLVTAHCPGLGVKV